MSERISVEKGSKIPPHMLIKGSDVYIDPDARVGVLTEASLRQWLTMDGLKQALQPVRVGDYTVVLDGAVIYEGVTLGSDCFVGRKVIIGAGSDIGNHCRLAHRADIGKGVTLGKGCIVGGVMGGQEGGSICDGAIIGEGCEVEGSLLAMNREHRDSTFVAPTLGDRVKVYAGAIIAGGVVIGPDVVVGPGARVTQSTPEGWVGLVMGDKEEERFDSMDLSKIELGRKRPERAIEVPKTILPDVI